MKLHKFIDNLNKLVEENPEIKDFDVIYSIDDEGNSFNKVYYSPSIGHFSGGGFRTEADIEDFNEEWEDEGELIAENSVCIN